MKINPITMIIVAIFLFPILRGIIFGFSANNAKRDTAGFVGSISFALSIYIGIKYLRNTLIINEHSVISSIIGVLPENISDLLQQNPTVVYTIVLLIMIYILYKLLYVILMLLANITIYQLIDVVENITKNRVFIFRRIIGAVLEVPRAICYLLVVLLFFNVASMFSTNKQFNNYLSDSNAYKYFYKQLLTPLTNSTVAKNLPEIIGDSLKVVVKQNDTNNAASGDNLGKTIVYYNGVTLEDAIKSNDAINSFAKRVTHGNTDTLGKAKSLYDWEGSSVSYDYGKANSVLNNDFNVKSGAIPTFNTKTGICFDYASLYVAMCRANGVKVRLVTGEGFNGTNWVSHAWNQVYVPDSNEWVNVDTTFAKGGNYFNNKMFDLDHKNAKVIGEWS